MKMWLIISICDGRRFLTDKKNNLKDLKCSTIVWEMN